MTHPVLVVRTAAAAGTHMDAILGDAYDKFTPNQPPLAMVIEAELALGGSVRWDVVEDMYSATRRVRFQRK